MNQSLRFLLFFAALLGQGCQKEGNSENNSVFTLDDKAHPINDYQISLIDVYQPYNEDMVYYYKCMIYTDALQPIFNSNGSIYQLRGTGWILQMILGDDKFPELSNGIYSTLNPNQIFNYYEPGSIRQFSFNYVEGGQTQIHYFGGESAQVQYNRTEESLQLISDSLVFYTYENGSLETVNAYLDFSAPLKSVILP